MMRKRNFQRRIREPNKAINTLNKDLEITVEHDSEFATGRLPTLEFEL